MLTWAAAWAGLAVFTLYRHWRHGRGVGLLLTYVFSFMALHWLAPMLHLLPWFDPFAGDLTAEGLRQSTIAMAGFVIGVELLAFAARSSAEDHAELVDADDSRRIVNVYFVVGATLYLATLLAGRIPIVAAIVSTGSTLVAVGVGLKCWSAWRGGRRAHMWFWVTASAAFPLLTVLTQGFLGYGFVAMLIVVSFVASLQRGRWKAAIGGLLLAYLGLSIYVTYMRDRTDIRDIVWGGQGVDVRVAQLQYTFANVEWFDPWNAVHLRRIDARLNQNHLIGAAVAYLREGNVKFAEGRTLVDAVIALVPRALWPDKPVVGGSGDLVSMYTGIRFSHGTSVGVGQVMELHVNFGTIGVFFGFIVIGALVAVVDRRAASRLASGNVPAFGLWYMPGLSLLQIGGSLAEVAATAAASVVLMLAISKIARPVSSRPLEPMSEQPRLAGHHTEASC